MRIGRRTIVVLLGLGALAAVAAIAGPWIAALFNGDLWADTIGYEVLDDPQTGRNLKIDFFASSRGGGARIAVISLGDGEGGPAAPPAAGPPMRSSFHFRDKRQMDTFSILLPLASIRPLPPVLFVEGTVEDRRPGAAEARTARFRLRVDTEPRRRNSVFDRTKVRWDHP